MTIFILWWDVRNLSTHFVIVVRLWVDIAKVTLKNWVNNRESDKKGYYIIQMHGKNTPNLWVSQPNFDVSIRCDVGVKDNCRYILPTKIVQGIYDKLIFYVYWYNCTLWGHLKRFFSPLFDVNSCHWAITALTLNLSSTIWTWDNSIWYCKTRILFSSLPLKIHWMMNSIVWPNEYNFWSSWALWIVDCWAREFV